MSSDQRGRRAPRTTSELTGPPSAFWSPVGVGSTTIGQVSEQRGRRPPGTPRGRAAQVSGRTSVTTTAPRDRRPERQAAGAASWPAGARGDGRRGHGARLGAGDPVSWPRASERRLDVVHLRPVRREVAVLAAPSGRARSARSRTRPAPPRRSAARRPAAASAAASPTVRAWRSDPGWASDRGSARRRARRPGRPSSRFRASPSGPAPDDVVGLATTIRWNSGNADEVDWR